MGLLSGLPESAEGWREAAVASLRSEGLPSKKTEAWRFTPVKDLVEGDFAASTAAIEVEAPEGVEVSRVEIHPRLGSVAPASHFAALNALRFEQAIVIRAKRPLRAPVVLRYAAPGASEVVCPRVLVIAEKGAELHLVERFEGAGGLINAVTEVVCEQGAIVEHARLHASTSPLVGLVAVEQARGSGYRSRVVSVGGRMRLDLRVAFAGEGASCTLEGVYHVTGGEHVDHHVYVDHAAPRCASRQRYRGIVDGRATAVFDGQAIVRRSGPGAEAHQENRNLLLSDGATVHTKPHLEIETDEVVASHGATVGTLDDGQLFYLRSRGVPQGVAEAILTDAFVRSLVDNIAEPDLRAEAGARLRARLPHGATLAAFDGSWEET